MPGSTRARDTGRDLLPLGLQTEESYSYTLILNYENVFLEIRHYVCIISHINLRKHIHSYSEIGSIEMGM